MPRTTGTSFPKALTCDASPAERYIGVRFALMTLLREIAHAASDPQFDLPSLLRKCKILAARLGSPEFSAWIAWELDGYPDEESTPHYRRLQAGFYGQFMSVAWRYDNWPREPRSSGPNLSSRFSTESTAV
jgi:hypothetical protein